MSDQTRCEGEEVIMAGTPSQTERKTRDGKKTIPAQQDRTSPSGAKKPRGKQPSS